MQNFCRINNHKNNFESTNFYYLQFNSTWVREKNFNKHPEGKVDYINKNKTVSVKTRSLIHYIRKEIGIPIICIAWKRGTKEHKRNSCILTFLLCKIWPHFLHHLKPDSLLYAQHYLCSIQFHRKPNNVQEMLSISNIHQDCAFATFYKTVLYNFILQLKIMKSATRINSLFFKVDPCKNICTSG